MKDKKEFDQAHFAFRYEYCAEWNWESAMSTATTVTRSTHEYKTWMKLLFLNKIMGIWLLLQYIEGLVEQIIVAAISCNQRKLHEQFLKRFLPPISRFSLNYLPISVTNYFVTKGVQDNYVFALGALSRKISMQNTQYRSSLGLSVQFQIVNCQFQISLIFSSVYSCFMSFLYGLLSVQDCRTALVTSCSYFFCSVDANSIHFQMSTRSRLKFHVI